MTDKQLSEFITWLEDEYKAIERAMSDCIERRYYFYDGQLDFIEDVLNKIKQLSSKE